MFNFKFNVIHTNKKSIGERPLAYLVVRRYSQFVNKLSIEMVDVELRDGAVDPHFPLEVRLI